MMMGIDNFGNRRAPPEAFSVTTEKTNRFSTPSFVSSGTICPSPCHIFNIHGYNIGTGSLYFMLFDSGSVPPNTDTSFIEILPVPSNTIFSFEYSTHGMTMFSGATFAFSTTSGSLTIAGTNPGRLNVTFNVR